VRNAGTTAKLCHEDEGSGRKKYKGKVRRKNVKKSAT